MSPWLWNFLGEISCQLRVLTKTSVSTKNVILFTIIYLINENLINLINENLWKLSSIKLSIVFICLVFGKLLDYCSTVNKKYL